MSVRGLMGCVWFRARGGFMGSRGMGLGFVFGVVVQGWQVWGSCCVHGSEWVSGYVLGSAFETNGLLARNLVGLWTGRLWARVGSGGSWGDVVSGS